MARQLNKPRIELKTKIDGGRLDSFSPSARKRIGQYRARVKELEFLLWREKMMLFTMRKEQAVKKDKYTKKLAAKNKDIRDKNKELLSATPYERKLKVHKSNLIEALIYTSGVIKGTIFKGDGFTVTQKVVVLLFASENTWINIAKYSKAYPSFDCGWYKTVESLFRMGYLGRMGVKTRCKHFITTDGKKEVERLREVALAAWRVPENNNRKVRSARKKTEPPVESSGG